MDMHRSQIYLSETHLGSLASYARARGTTHSALVREALDEYLARQAPVDKRALRSQAFAAWAVNPDAPSLAELRREERSF
jgi:Ribbon-helix-helix protein, copG family